MCLGVPGRIIDVRDSVATVDFWGVRKEVRLDIIDEPVVAGDYILNHVGFAIRRIPPESVAEMLRPRSHVADMSAGYGFGFWVNETTGRAGMVGDDAGTSFWSTHDPASATTITVMSNVTDGTEHMGAWLRQHVLTPR